MTTRIHSHAGITRYLQVYNVLSQALAEGTLDTHGVLPSEPELARRFHVSRTTIRRALSRLAAEGIIERRRGSGTFVRGEERFHGAQGRFIQSLHEIGEARPDTTTRLIEFARVPTPSFLRRQWPEFGKTALRIRRTCSLGDKPFMLSTAYVPGDVGQRITRHHLGHRPLLVVLDDLGYHAARAEQTTTAVAADPFAARHLDAVVGAPLLNVRHVLRDAGGRIIKYQDHTYRPDRCELRVVIEHAGQDRPHEEL